MSIRNPHFTQMLGKARDAAACGINAMSTGEALAAAPVLNRPDRLAAMNYTIAEAKSRVGPDRVRAATLPAMRAGAFALAYANRIAVAASRSPQQGVQPRCLPVMEASMEMNVRFEATGRAPLVSRPLLSDGSRRRR